MYKNNHGGNLRRKVDGVVGGIGFCSCPCIIGVDGSHKVRGGGALKGTESGPSNRCKLLRIDLLVFDLYCSSLRRRGAPFGQVQVSQLRPPRNPLQPPQNPLQPPRNPLHEIPSSLHEIPSSLHEIPSTKSPSACTKSPLLNPLQPLWNPPIKVLSIGAFHSPATLLHQLHFHIYIPTPIETYSTFTVPKPDLQLLYYHHPKHVHCQHQDRCPAPVMTD